MKQLLSLLIIGLALTASSCASSLSTRMDEYIAECERNCENWTESDWELSKQEYRKLLDEYKLNQDSYSQEEKDGVNKAIGRYNGLLVKHGIEDLSKSLKKIGERIPSLIEGFMSAFEEETDEK
jgi:hypothetical protein